MGVPPLHIRYATHLLGRLRALGSDSVLRFGALAVLVLAVPQLYLVPAEDVSLSTILTVALIPCLLIALAPAPVSNWAGSWLLPVLAGLGAARLLALAWSPVPVAGLQPIVLLGQFAVTFVLMRKALAADPALFSRPSYKDIRSFDLARGTYDGPPMRIQPTGGMQR